MPSGRAKRLPSLEPVVFFLDRGLGRHVLANALRDEGQAVLTMAEIYPDGANMVVSDPDWIRRSNDEGWIALTKDPAIIFAHATCSRKRPCACLRSTT